MRAVLGQLQADAVVGDGPKEEVVLEGRLHLDPSEVPHLGVISGHRFLSELDIELLLGDDLSDIADQFPVDREMTVRSEEHTSELQSLMRISSPVFFLKKIKQHHFIHTNINRLHISSTLMHITIR